MTYLVKQKKIVTPGELLAEGSYNSGKNTYTEENRIYASRLGLAGHIGKNVYVIAIKGFYTPNVGDLVIGKVFNMRLTGWIIDINAPYSAILFASDAVGRSFNARRDNLSDFLDLGDLVLAKVNLFNRTRDPILTIREEGLGKIRKGHLIKITPTKIPRVIGRKGSMINALKRKTGCYITIGQNGLILVSGQNLKSEVLAIKAIRTIEKEAHKAGLTEKINEILRKEEDGKNDGDKS